MNQPTNCLEHGCDKIARTRGLCYRHYNALVREIKAGKLTMSEAERRGRAHVRKHATGWGRRPPEEYTR